ncbi:MAG: hypothetical protein K2Q01_03755 [Rickettsiales bacterium]|nr:hypothetical protein [Rickettsiales bacterium]
MSDFDQTVAVAGGSANGHAATLGPRFTTNAILEGTKTVRIEPDAKTVKMVVALVRLGDEAGRIHHELEGKSQGSELRAIASRIAGYAAHYERRADPADMEQMAKAARELDALNNKLVGESGMGEVIGKANRLSPMLKNFLNAHEAAVTKVPLSASQGTFAAL